MDLKFVDARAQGAFAAVGIDSLEALCASPLGEVVTSASTRRCVRLELDGDVYYTKTQQLRLWQLPLARWPSYLLRGSPLRRERRALALLADAGFRTPTVVAAASTPPGRLYVQAALITRGVPDHVDLATWAASPRADDDAVARATFDAAEALVRRAHGLGIALLGAKYRNLLVPTDGCDDAAQVVVLDQPSLERSNSRRLHERDDALLAFDRERYGRGR